MSEALNATQRGTFEDLDRDERRNIRPFSWTLAPPSLMGSGQQNGRARTANEIINIKVRSVLSQRRPLRSESFEADSAL
jgi:hypothetical protein